MRPRTALPKTTERKEAQAFMQWARTIPVLDELLFHIPNERKTTPYEGHLLKLEGVKSGVSDYFLPLPRGKYFGLWLELKRDVASRLTPAQDYWLAKMRTNGYAAYVAYGAIAAIDITKKYLAGNL